MRARVGVVQESARGSASACGSQVEEQDLPFIEDEEVCFALSFDLDVRDRGPLYFLPGLHRILEPEGPDRDTALS